MVTYEIILKNILEWVCDLTNNTLNRAYVNLISYSIFDGKIDYFDGVKGVVFSAIPFFI